MATTLTTDDLAAFERDGYLRIPAAFPDHAAAQMRDIVWTELASRGIKRDDPGTWTEEMPTHLQHLKSAPVFAEIGSERTTGAIDDVLGEDGWKRPSDWGAFFLLFPTARPWTVPSEGWHVDHGWTDPPFPVRELKVQALYGDVEPRAGGMTIVAGSHRLVASVVEDLAIPPGTAPAKIRLAVMAGHPYLRDLSAGDGDPLARAARFLVDEDASGFPVRVVELCGDAGDVFLIHPLVLHTRPINAGTAPRLMLNKDLYL